jgi:hypothetical protein
MQRLLYSALCSKNCAAIVSDAIVNVNYILNALKGGELSVVKTKIIRN